MRSPMRLSPVVLLLVFVSIVAPAIATAQPPGGGRGGQIRSPEIAADGTVTFRLRAPNAKEVIVVGFGQKLPMQKDEQGVWTATTGVLKPDIYTYTLLGGRRDVQRPGQPVLQDVLPRWMAEQVSCAGRGGLGSGSGYREARSRGTSTRRPSSATTATTTSTRRPTTIATGKEPYPVLYLLHGLGDDAAGWLLGAARRT